MQIEILVGSTMGAAEYVADEIQALLESTHQVRIHLNPDFNQLKTECTDSFWFVCSSTHGAGDVPDNLVPFYKGLEETTSSLEINYAVIAIGSRSYDTFCQAGLSIHALLKDKGAKAIIDPLCIDVDLDPVPEEPAIEWTKQWLHLLN